MTINPNSQQAYQLLHNGTLALARAERQGFRIDMEYAIKKKDRLEYKINLLENNFKKTKFYKHWNHTTKNIPNINSNTQLAYFLYTTKKLKPIKLTASGKGATGEEALLLLNIPELNDLLQIKKLKKVKNTYLGAFIREQVNGYIHPSFNLNLVRTFRSSSNSPNFQNIPIRDKESMKICRKALYPRPGHQLLEVDFSGLEVAISACYHKDPNMLKYLNTPSSDLHGDLTKQIFKIKKFDRSKKEHSILRAATKNGFIFPQFYGDYYRNNAISLSTGWCGLPESKWKTGQGIEFEGSHISNHLIEQGLKSYQHFENHIKEIEYDFWNNRFPDYRRWKKTWWSLYQRYGYIDMKTGFRCSGVMTKNDAINYPVQGAAFHCLLWCFIELDKRMLDNNWDTKLIGQIHDSIIFDVNPNELQHVSKIIKEVTSIKLQEAWKWIITPLKVDFELSPVDCSWADKKEWKL